MKWIKLINVNIIRHEDENKIIGIDKLKGMIGKNQLGALPVFSAETGN